MFNKRSVRARAAQNWLLLRALRAELPFLWMGLSATAAN
jgi:hypothetical protein